MQRTGESPWLLTSSLSFQTPQMTHPHCLPPTPEMELQWCDCHNEFDSCTLCFVATKSWDLISYVLVFVSIGNSVGMSCSLAHPVLPLHPLLMPSLLSIKAWDTIIPILHPSLSPSANKTATQLPLSSLFRALYQSLSLLSLSTSYGSRRSQ